MSNLNISGTNTVQSTGGVADKKAGMNNKNPTDFSEAIATRSGENLAASQGVAVDADMIKVNQGNIEALRAEEMKALPSDILIKALSESGIEQNESTMAITKTLVNNGMELTEKNITNLFLYSQIFKNAPINTLALLMKLEIPVTAENIAQFAAVSEGTAKLADTIESLITNMPAEIIEASGNSGAKLADNLTKFIDILTGGFRDLPKNPARQNAQVVTRNQDMQQTPSNPLKLAEGGFLLSAKDLASLAVTLRSMGATNAFVSKLANLGRQQPQTEAEFSRMSSELLDTVKNFIQELPARLNLTVNRNEGENTDERAVLLNAKLFENLKELLNDPVLKNLLRNTAEDKWLIKPEKLNGAELEKFFRNLDVNITRLELAFKGTGSEKLQSEAKSINDNLNFLNDLNKNMTFFQLPLRLENQVTNSDLYVFTDKKRKNAGASNNLNILLRLELDNIGKLDIYMNMAGKDIRSRFFTQNESAVHEIAGNMDELGSTITKLGFNFSSTVTKTEKGFDFIDDFVNRKLAKAQVDKTAGKFYV